MVDLTTLPFSRGEKFDKTNNDTYFTYDEDLDYRNDYNDLDVMLYKLEASVSSNHQALEEICRLADLATLPLEERQDVKIRIDWLLRLYHVEKNLGSIRTLEESAALRLSIVPVQSCLMKNKMIAILKSLEKDLSSTKLHTEQPIEQRLMEKALEEAGDSFINLGKVGREFIIKEILETHSENPEMIKIIERKIALEKDVKALKYMLSKVEFFTQLKTLPLSSLEKIPANHLDEIVDLLMKESGYDGLLSLDQTIEQIYSSFLRVEVKQHYIEVESNTTLTIVNNSINGPLTINKLNGRQ